MAHVIVEAEQLEARAVGQALVRSLGAQLGVSAFGINQLELPAGGEGIAHDHGADGQEEVYVIIAGHGTIRVDADQVAVRPGHVVFVSPEETRQMVAGDHGLRWIGVGAPARTDPASR